MNSDLVREITQSIIAVIIVVGGGYILATQPTAQTVPVVVSIITAVVTYYFTRSQTRATVSSILKAQDVNAILKGQGNP